MRRATIRTEHDRPEVVAAALWPDNTDEMTTRVEWDVPEGSGDGDAVGTVVTVIERESTAGLRSTVDDYVTNLAVANRLTTQP